MPERVEAGRAAPLTSSRSTAARHGRDFLWAWLPRARARGFLLAPAPDPHMVDNGREDVDAPLQSAAVEK